MVSVRRSPPCPQACPPLARGVMLIGLMIGLALSSIALMAMVDMWSMDRQREREQQLLYVGDQYRVAIRSYFYAAPSGTPRMLPQTLQVLLEDDRYPSPLRHLRRLYPDPISGSPDWGLLRMDGRISAVYSLSERTPIKQAGFAPIYDWFSGKTKYQDWVFAFTPPGRLAPGNNQVPALGQSTGAGPGTASSFTTSKPAARRASP